VSPIERVAPGVLARLIAAPAREPAFAQRLDGDR
jgi:hypothetical protein